MPPKLITSESRAVCLRFVRAYEELRYLGISGTKTEFAREIGTTASNLKRIEDSETNEPSIHSIIQLLTKYNVNPDWLFFGKEPFLRK